MIFSKKTILTAMACLIAGSLPGAYRVPDDLDTFEGKKIFTIGNSHTDSIRGELGGLAAAAGHKVTIGTHTIPGAPLRILIQNTKGSVEALKNHAWDVVTLQTYNSTNEKELQAALDFTKAAMEGNPDVHIVIYTIWPQDENWDSPSYGRSEEWTTAVAKHIKENFPDVNVSVTPSSLAIRKVGSMADAGLVPNFESRRDLYKDPGHMGPNGAYVITGCMIPIIWGTSPLELPNEMYGTSRGYPTEEIAYTVPPESAEVIKRAIYDVMAGFEGDNFDPGMVINEGFLPPALLGREYEQELPVINAPSAPSWTLVSGELPEGLKLQDGKITGTPTEEKKAGFTVKAEADGETAERRLTLYAEKERPLEIVEPEIKKLARDEYFLTTLKSEGAIGRTTWSIAEGEGEMPKGFRLNDSGLLLGTPGESGTFEPTLRVTDNHPVEPRTATRQLTIEVGPPSEGTAIVPRVTEEWKQDGKLDEPFWDFKHEIKKDGKTAGTFSLVYIEDPEKRNPSKTRDLLLAVKVDAAENSPVPPEAVHVYIDAAHNRELIYNEDDLHWYVEKSGKEEVPQGYKSDHALDEAVTVNDDGSWQMEVEISRKVFAGFGVHTTFGPNISYGFDVAIGSVEDPEQRAYWQGDPSIDEDTSGFGSIVLEGPEAAEEEE